MLQVHQSGERCAEARSVVHVAAGLGQWDVSSGIAAVQLPILVQAGQLLFLKLLHFMASKGIHLRGLGGRVTTFDLAEEVSWDSNQREAKKVAGSGKSKQESSTNGVKLRNTSSRSSLFLCCSAASLSEACEVDAVAFAARVQYAAQRLPRSANSLFIQSRRTLSCSHAG